MHSGVPLSSVPPNTQKLAHAVCKRARNPDKYSAEAETRREKKKKKKKSEAKGKAKGKAILPVPLQIPNYYIIGP